MDGSDETPKPSPEEVAQPDPMDVIRRQATGQLNRMFAEAAENNPYKKAERLESESRIDEKTGLRNEKAFKDDFLLLLNNEKRLKGDEAKIAVVFIDFNNLKKYNDEYQYVDEVGTVVQKHAMGDMAIKDGGKVLDAAIKRKGTDRVYRLHGDEFVLLMPEGTEESAINLVQTMSDQLAQSPVFGKFPLNACFGINVFSLAGQTDMGKLVDDTLRNADTIMYEAKKEKGELYQNGDASLRSFAAVYDPTRGNRRVTLG